LALADVAVLAEWTNGRKPTSNESGSTTFRILQIARTPKKAVRVGGQVTLGNYRSGGTGDLFLLTGAHKSNIEWDKPLPISEIGYYYVVQAPTAEELPSKRLTYFLKFLDSPDSLISNDAYSEFAKAPYEQVSVIANVLDRKRVRRWLESKKTPANRIGLYGLMIGICGNASDADFLKNQIAKTSDDFRLGINGMIAGYLLLQGEKGLDFIDQTMLANPKTPDGEAYAAMQALRFLWSNSRDQFDVDRMRRSMRILLDRPNMAELAIRDLARWKDWSALMRLRQLYGADKYESIQVRRAIVGYLLACANDIPNDQKDDPPKHVKQAQLALQALRKQDPKTVRQAERLFLRK
jgi:nitrogen fixation-related uncharacterized protein